MSKKWAAGCITLFLLLGTYGALFTYFSLNKQAMPLAVNGTLDLSQWRFEEDGVIELEGEWELYPGKLLSKQDFEGQQSANGLPSMFIEVSGTWSEYIDPIGCLRLWSQQPINRKIKSRHSRQGLMIICRSHLTWMSLKLESTVY